MKSSMLKVLMVVAVLALGAVFSLPAAHASLISNGDFEIGNLPDTVFTTLFAGNTNITGWTVGAGGVDYIGSYWQPASGARSVDLSGNAPGFVLQSFNTTAGATYTVSFYMAGNPDGSADKTMRVTYGTGLFKDFTFSQTGHTKVAMGWEKEEFTFSGTGLPTALQFASTTGNAFGPALDNVNVNVNADVVVPIPPSALLLGSGLLGLVGLGWRRKKTS